MKTYGSTGKTFTEMCIYIDENFYDNLSDNAVMEKCYIYFYTLLYTLAAKDKMFHSADDYDMFALYGASRLYFRYINGKEKVVSVKNYVNSIIYALRADYLKGGFGQVVDKQDEIDISMPANNDGIMRVEFSHYLGTLPQTIKGFLKQTYFANDKVMFHNIYMSCLLSILSSITLSQPDRELLASREQSKKYEQTLNSVYKNEKKVVLYNVDKSMENYIASLVNELYTLIRKDLLYIIGQYESDEDMLKSVLGYNNE